jgi:hypothetical protein
LLVAGKIAAYGETGLPALSSFGGRPTFGLFAARPDRFVNFTVAEGPTPGTMSLIAPSGTADDPYGLCFASNFVDSFDLRSVDAQPFGPDDMYLGELESYVLDDNTVTSPSGLVNPSGKASNYESCTFEFFINPPKDC